MWQFVLQAQERGMQPVQVKIDGTVTMLYQQSHALLIGVSAYSAGLPLLPGVSEDINIVKSTLESAGFEVITVMNPDMTALQKAFSSFITNYGNGLNNRLLIYFAGHGYTEKMPYGDEIGYICPVDAPDPNKNPAGFQEQAMPMRQIETYAYQIKSKHALFVFDACFSGSIFATSRAIPEVISYKTKEPVRQFITSGSANETVPDKSIFRDQFVRALNGEADGNKDGYVTGTELGEFLQSSVINYSYGSQHPQYGKIRNPNLDKGDFVFVLSGDQQSSSESSQTSVDNRQAEKEPIAVVTTSESARFTCGQSFTVTHQADDVAPVTKTVTYGTVETDLTGKRQCWITQNLGADRQAISATDASEEAAGWYWQFNRKQGYEHDSTTRIPGTIWTSPINENGDWQATKDPCELLLGAEWRLPTYIDWDNAQSYGEWSGSADAYACVLKLHAAGYLGKSGGTLYERRSYGYYWCSSQYNDSFGWFLSFYSGNCGMSSYYKAYGFSVRCLRD